MRTRTVGAVTSANDHLRWAASQREFELPEGAAQFILVRHGATIFPVDGDGSGDIDHADAPLAQRDHAQAAAVAERLGVDPIERLFVTPLRRTQETARPLAARLGLEPDVVPELREIHLGDWDNREGRMKLISDDPIAEAVFREERWDAIPNAEPMEAFGARVRSGILRIAGEVGHGTAVAVAHGGTIGETCRQATGSRPFAFVASNNGSITRLLVFPDGAWTLLGFNDVSHLPRATSLPPL